MSITEGPEELTLRVEEVCSQKACINVGHTAEDRWGPPWQTLIGMPSARRSTKVLKAETGENCTISTKEDEGGQRQERGFL